MRRRSALAGFLFCLVAIAAIVGILVLFDVINFEREDEKLKITIDSGKVEEAGEKTLRKTGEALEEAGEELQNKDGESDRAN